MRRLVRGAVGGDCIFFQGAGGNVLPRFCFTGDEAEAVRMGTQLGVAALAAVAGRRAYDVEITSFEDRSATPYHIYRREPVEPGPTVLGSASEVVTVPLLPHPTLEEVEEELVRREADLEAAREEGVIRHVKVAYYWAAWARSTAAALRDGTAPTEVSGPVHAVRIGDGAVVTGPGETFAEYGLAVKERSPASPTLYAGYTNGLLGYLPTAAEYAFDGYEAGYGHKGAGLPSLFDPAVERICVETGVRLVESLFPEATPWDPARGWTASGTVPLLEPPPPLEHPGTASGRRPLTRVTRAPHGLRRRGAPASSGASPPTSGPSPKARGHWSDHMGVGRRTNRGVSLLTCQTTRVRIPGNVRSVDRRLRDDGSTARPGPPLASRRREQRGAPVRGCRGSRDRRRRRRHASPTPAAAPSSTTTPPTGR